jgi:hypothetical protein
MRDEVSPEKIRKKPVRISLNKVGEASGEKGS